MYLWVNFEVRSGYGGPFLSIPVRSGPFQSIPVSKRTRCFVLQRNDVSKALCKRVGLPRTQSQWICLLYSSAPPGLDIIETSLRSMSPIGTASHNSVKSDHECTLRIYFDNAGDNLTLSLENVTLTSYNGTQTSRNLFGT